MSDLGCEHKEHICKLVYGLDISGRVHMCKLCGETIPCEHFKTKPATLSYKHAKRHRIAEALPLAETDDLDSLI